MTGCRRPGGHSEVTVSNRMRLAALVVVLVATAGAVAACGSSAKGTGSAAANTPNSPNGFAAYTDCLRRNGVTLPSGFPRGNRPSGRPGNRPSARPSGGARGGFGFGDQAPPGVDQQTWQKAQQACMSLRPSSGPGGGRGNNGAFTAYRNCLADHGVTMSRGPGQLNTTDPTVAAAVKACQALLPVRPTPSAGG
jgi:hypothetical protein